MELILLLVIGGAIGYLLSNRSGRKPDEQAAKPIAIPQRIGKQAISLRAWAAGPAAGDLPDDFKRWLASLTDQEAQDFTQALSDYSSGLGFQLDDLLNGNLKNQPALMQVYVEAVVVYSNAYRKARQARQEAEATKTQADKQTQTQDAVQPVPSNGKEAAQKQPSRRKSEPVGGVEAPSAS